MSNIPTKGGSSTPSPQSNSPVCNQNKDDMQDNALVGYLYRLSGYQVGSNPPQPLPDNLNSELNGAQKVKDQVRELSDLMVKMAQDLGPFMMLCQQELNTCVLQFFQCLGIVEYPGTGGDPIWCPSVRDWVDPPSDCEDYST